MAGIPTLGRRGEGWVVIQVILLAAIGLAGLAGLGGPSWTASLRIAAVLAGAALVTLGLVQAGRAMRELGDNLTPLPRPLAGAHLVETGIYSSVRHPIYGGVILGGVGWALLTASPVALALATVLVPFFWLKSTVEERWLEERFSDYASYRRRTRRFIAWPG